MGSGIRFESEPPDTETYGPAAPPLTPEEVAALETRARAGEAGAQRELGILAYRGRGVPEDRAEAFKWLTLAARQEDALAARFLEFIGPTVSTAEAYQGRCRVSEITGEPPPAPPTEAAMGATYTGPDREQLYAQAIAAMQAQGLMPRDDSGSADSAGTPPVFLPPQPPVRPPPPPRPILWAATGVGLLAVVGTVAFVLHKVGRDQPEFVQVPGQGKYSLQSGTNKAGSQSASGDLAALRKAAEGGEVRAQFELGLAYARGVIVGQNLSAAAEWYRKAALQRDIGAMNNLGVLYIKGTGVSRDLVQAYQWLHLAAAGGSAGSGNNRDQIALYMTADQIAEAMRLATAQRQAWVEAAR